jgi:hypothetical protein
MNSYGSVSRVSESIYKLLRYMNWVSGDDNDVDAIRCAETPPPPH